MLEGYPILSKGYLNGKVKVFLVKIIIVYKKVALQNNSEKDIQKK